MFQRQMQINTLDSNLYSEIINLIQSDDLLYQMLLDIQKIPHEKFYIGAGAIAQSIWNAKFGYHSGYGISDIDVVYFNNDDLSEAAENVYTKIIVESLAKYNIHLDVKNQARVHVWYKRKFGSDILPIQNINDSISRWPTTATAIAVRIDKGFQFEIVAPFGLNDLLSCTIKPNKTQITELIYREKVQKWVKIWPKLNIEEW